MFHPWLFLDSCQLPMMSYLVIVEFQTRRIRRKLISGMNGFIEFLVTYGLPLLFLAILLEQLGLPLPALPWLLAVGALSANAKFSAPAGIAVATMACLVADSTWFYLGRHQGNRLLALLCRISLEPDSCVRRTENAFTRYGLRTLLVSKFIPGLNTVAAPLAGASKVSVRRFLLFDATGALIYASCYILLGYFFRNQIEQIVAALASIGKGALLVLAFLIAGYLGLKLWRRQMLLRELRMTRITVAELRQKLDAGENPLIFDLRANPDGGEELIIPGAVRISMDELGKSADIPRDRDIIVYCACPNEVSAARVAVKLRQKGFTRVRPLKGGIDAWRKHHAQIQVSSVGPASRSEAKVVVGVNS
jgi:membrane protein DedA with SNARE-associated domain/rhodanese-related sulfurtransferase